ncbi:MAG: S-layer homology domain-containing protein, partial [Clostridia bacterium]|nr:S-layer homology domain-containing protein [Clostridia bacterium]
MRTFKSLLAAVLMVVMMLCMSVSSFAAYEQYTYDDLNEMFNTTLSMQMNQYVKFVDALGIVSAYKNGDFNPSASITRGEALKIAYRMLHYNYDEIEEYTSMNTGFDEGGEGGDINDVHMLKPYVAWAQDYQLINSAFVPELKFEPDKAITGAEFMTLMTKVVAKYVDIEDEVAVEDFQMVVMDVLDPDSDFSLESETVNREAAAVIVARTMLYDPVVADVSDDMFVTFADWDGNRLNCLATEIYGCNSTDLTVRATKQRPLDYEGIIHDVLFSNGAEVDVGFDMSSFIGYEMKVVYLDKDGSGTFTEDEEFITYEVGSPWIHKVHLGQLNIAGYGSIIGVSTENPFTLYSNSLLYLNDNAWPNSKAYNLTDLVDFVSFQAPAPITNRPNLEFTFIQHSSAENVDTVFANEWIPGKIMTVTDDYISVYSYYDDKVHVYNDNDVEMTAIANPASGDFVDFYEANDRLYMKAGTTVTTSEYRAAANGAKVNLTIDGTTYTPHLFYSKGSTPATMLTGEITAVLDASGTTYIAAEEVHATKDVAVEILSAVESGDGMSAELEVRELTTNETYPLVV